MKCPACNKSALIPDNAVANAENYGNPLVVTTDCCQALVRLYPQRTYRLDHYEGPRKEDDWGRPAKEVRKRAKAV